MDQGIENNGPVEIQANIGENKGTINFVNKTRWAKRFTKLKEEVLNDIRFEQFLDDLLDYNTLLDGRSMPEKLEDGGYSEHEILSAARYKDSYSKKAQKNRFYESAQRIDVEIFGFIKLNFETYVHPLIEARAQKSAIKIEVNEKIITPMMNILNTEGSDDDHLNYSAPDILGMLYFLTGKCHINWANYDNIQPSI